MRELDLCDLLENDRRWLFIEWFDMVAFAIRAGRKPIQNESARLKIGEKNRREEKIGR